MVAGSSPRVWGTPYRLWVVLDKPRFIPTGVGNAKIGCLVVKRRAVHPHGCGERGRCQKTMLRILGSSPRVWGTLWCWPYLLSGSRFIPTGVGNALVGSYPAGWVAVHPHGCGERVYSPALPGETCGSSPRVWGTLFWRSRLSWFRRFIPTGVGNALIQQTRDWRKAVHPHGCGERNKSASR